MSEGVCCFRHVGMSAHTYVKYAKDKNIIAGPSTAAYQNTVDADVI